MKRRDGSSASPATIASMMECTLACWIVLFAP